ncbi:MAG: alpha-galactosidase [Firmicutes bacterium]|nr:alpha-galactosidase [Bacillota bacterium]
MSNLKISFIGAGSFGFTYKLVADILSFDNLKAAEFCFMDIDRERLDNLKILLDSYFRLIGCENKAVYTTNRTEALSDAGFVFNLVKIGMMEASRQDMNVPKKFGLYQTIGDTCCVGGIFRGLRTMVFNKEMLLEMEKVSNKNAVVLNYTNPQAMTVMAAQAVSKIPFIGLCHSVQGTTRAMACTVEIPYEELNFECAGINHMAFITKFEKDSEDLYPLFKSITENSSMPSGGKYSVSPELGMVRIEMMRELGYMVTESSTHFPEYVPYFLKNKHTAEKYHIEIDRYEKNIEEKEERYFKLIKEAREDGLTVANKSDEYGANIINAMTTGVPIKIYANVMNDGLIDTLPEDSCVEVVSMVDKNGVQPCRYGSLPTQLSALCRSNINVHQLAVEAFLRGDRKYIKYAFMADPLTASTLTLSEMDKVIDELLMLQQQYFSGLFD